MDACSALVVASEESTVYSTVPSSTMSPSSKLLVNTLPATSDLTLYVLAGFRVPVPLRVLDTSRLDGETCT